MRPLGRGLPWSSNSLVDNYSQTFLDNELPLVSRFSSKKVSINLVRLMARARSNNDKSNSSANIGFEQKLWLAADKLWSNMDAAEYKHVVLGLIFLKYISDSFEEQHAKLLEH